MVMAPIAEFGPDMPDLASTTMIAINVVPRTEASYGPLASLQPYSDALGSICTGAISVQDHVGSTYIIAGTNSGLFMLSGGDTTWNDVSKSGGYNGTGEYWHFAQFKDLIIATNYTDPIQVFDLSTSTTFDDLSADAPHARFVTICKNFVMVADTDEAVGGAVRQRSWWSGLNEPANWPLVGSAAAQAVQSDYNDLVGAQGPISGLIGHLGGCDVAIFFERGVWRGIYQGPPGVFGFYPAEGVLGTRAFNSLVQVGPVVYYLGEDGFYVFDGTSSVPIGFEKVDRWFFANVNITYHDKIIGAVDATSKLVFWLFPSRASSSGAPDTALIYNWGIKRWSYATLAADWIMNTLSFGTGLDALDAIYPGGLDTIPYSLDSSVFIGGALQLAAIDSDHKLAFFSGDNMAAEIATSTTQIVQGQPDPNTGALRPGMRAFVRSVRPLVEGGSPTVALSLKQTLTQTLTWTADVPINTMGECPQRGEGRYITGLVKLAAGDVWDHFQGIDVTADPAGWR